MRAHLWSLSPKAEAVGQTIEAWDRVLGRLLALGRHRVALAWHHVTLAWHRTLKSLGELTSHAPSISTPWAPPASHPRGQLVPRRIPRPMTLIPRLPAPNVRLMNAKAPVTRGTSLITVPMDDDEPTIIHHFIPPSASVIDERHR